MMKRAQRLKAASSRLPFKFSLVVAAGISSASSLAHAQGFTITGACEGSGITIYSNDTCAANLINGEEGIMKAGSSLTRVGDGLSTVYAVSNNTLTLNGDISADGFNAKAVNLDETNDLSLGGNVTVIGQSSQGIAMNEGNTASISGTVSTDGQDSHAIDAKLSNILDVRGNLTVTGESSRGINLEQDNTLDMSGTITTDGRSSRGIYADTGNTVNISGNISAEGQSAAGLIAVSGNTLNVTGRIQAAGLTTHAIQLDSNNTVNVSGTLIADGNAIYASGTGNTLNFTSGAFIIGSLESLGSGTTVNIDLGTSRPVAWQFNPDDISEFNISSDGTQAYDANTGLYVTYDDSPLLALLTAPLDLIDDTDIQTPGAGWAVRLAYDTNLENDSSQPRIALARAIGNGDLRLGLAATSYENDKGGSASSTSLMAGYSYLTNSLMTLDFAAAFSIGELERTVNNNTSANGIETYSSEQTNMAFVLGASMPLPARTFGGVSLISALDGQLIYARSGEVDEGTGAGAANLEASDFTLLNLGGEVTAIFGMTQISAGIDSRQKLSGELSGTLGGLDVTYNSDSLDKITPSLGAATIVNGTQIALDFDFEDDTALSLSATWSL